MPGQTVLEKPVRIYRLQTEKSAFYCYISLGKKIGIWIKQEHPRKVKISQVQLIRLQTVGEMTGI
jgi:hypothetical protein